MKTAKYLFASLLGIGLISCSAILPIAKDLLLGASKDGGISAEAQIGDRENDIGAQIDGSTGARDIKTGSGSTVDVKSENSNARVGNANRVTVQNVPPWVMLLLLLGWLLPTPSSIFKGIKNKIWPRPTRPHQ